jgi:hypothetical protein
MAREDLTRRGFLERSVLGSAAAGAAMSFEERALLAAARGDATPPAPAATAGDLPRGKIGDLRLGRLICGGNLLSGSAHARDLAYVSALLKHYFTDEKACETLALCEKSGMDAMILRVDEQILRLVKRYRAAGGAMRWIAQAKPPVTLDLETDIRMAGENGAVGAYLQGQVADRLAAAGTVSLIGKFLDLARKRGLVAGVGGHKLATIVACEDAKLEPDFYMKTLHSKEYWSARAPERHDNIFDETPEETVRFMAGVERPWIAFKVMAAGAIRPEDGFLHAFRGGADFICAGMFDFQVAEDVAIAKRVLAGLSGRDRPWRG